MPLQPGRKAIESFPEIGPARVLTRADLSHLTVPRKPNHVQSLRDNHHRIARAIASGIPNGEVASTCGISINRVSMFKADPSCAELIAHYRGIITIEWANQDTVIEFMRGNALKAQAMLSDKLDDAAERNEFLPTRDLLGIAELGLDRTGYGKVNKNLNVNIDFAAKLEGAIKRSSQANSVRTIEAQPLQVMPQSPSMSPSMSRPLPTSSKASLLRRV